MRSMEDVKRSNRHNQTKFLILKIFIRPPSTYFTSEDIAFYTGLTQNNVSRALKRLVGQKYIWRKNIGKKSYRYRYLKPMGERVTKQLFIRNRLSELTGEPRDLHIKIPLTQEQLKFLPQIEEEYNLFKSTGLTTNST
ncbi:hypothetical protein METP1_00075 [Methanosarcinales archaeon]|nr:hypothetical protein METP1_00075 [Methanosarcinales archaeon]